MSDFIEAFVLYFRCLSFYGMDGESRNLYPACQGMGEEKVFEQHLMRNAKALCYTASFFLKRPTWLKAASKFNAQMLKRS